MLSIVRMSLCVLLLVLPSLAVAEYPSPPPNPVEAGVRWRNIGTNWPGWVTFDILNRPAWGEYAHRCGPSRPERQVCRDTIATLEYRMVFNNGAVFGVQVGAQQAWVEHWYCGWGSDIISVWARYGQKRKAVQYVYLGCVGADAAGQFTVDVRLTPGVDADGKKRITIQHTGGPSYSTPALSVPFNWGIAATKVVLQGFFNRNGHPIEGSMLFNTPPPSRGTPYNHSETYTVEYPTTSNDLVRIHGDFVRPPIP